MAIKNHQLRVAVTITERMEVPDVLEVMEAQRVLVVLVDVEDSKMKTSDQAMQVQFSINVLLKQYPTHVMSQDIRKRFFEVFMNYMSLVVWVMRRYGMCAKIADIFSELSGHANFYATTAFNHLFGFPSAIQ
ncbi:hypothetical protein Tco_0588446 [Tanacetum coccineum]